MAHTSTTLGYCTYQDIKNSADAEFSGIPEIENRITPGIVIKYTLDACQRITQTLHVVGEYTLQLAIGTTDYAFNDASPISSAELPTKFYQIKHIYRTETNRREVRIVSLDQLEQQTVKDEGYTYTADDIPLLAAIIMGTTGEKSLRLYPAPDTAKTLSVYGRIRIHPGNYRTAVVGDAIPLDEHYRYLVEKFVFARLARQPMTEFEAYLAEEKKSTPNHVRMRMDYQ